MGVRDWLGLPVLPPFPDLGTAGSMTFGGVSYVSCAGGILDKSGQHYVSSLIFGIFFKSKKGSLHGIIL
jgi:hypothetical protein